MSSNQALANEIRSFDEATQSYRQLSATALIDKVYDHIAFSNPDANGNYQTMTFKTGGSGGTTVRTLTLAYDASDNVTAITRS